MGMATGQGRTPETEANSGGGRSKFKIVVFVRKIFEIMYDIYFPLLTYRITEESKRYHWLSKRRKRKTSVFTKSTSARSEPLFLYGQTYPKNVKTRKILRYS